jgi:hypothetical protein
VIAVHLVVQFQAVVTQAPVVANASHPIDHHRVDAQRAQRCDGGQTGVAATDHQHLRVAVVVANCALPAVEPVGPAELTIECRLLLSQVDCGFVVAMQAAQSREQHPGTRLFASGVRRGSIWKFAAARRFTADSNAAAGQNRSSMRDASCVCNAAAKASNHLAMIFVGSIVWAGSVMSKEVLLKCARI